MPRLAQLLGCVLLATCLPVATAAFTSSSGETSITPVSTITRGEAVNLLYRQFQEDIDQTEHSMDQVRFLDVSPDSPLLPLLAHFCAAEAITCTGGDFLPDEPVSFPAVLKMYDVLLHFYTDAPIPGLAAEGRAQPNWNEEYMDWAAELGLVPNGTLMTPVTGAAMEAFLAKDTYLKEWHYAIPHARVLLPMTLEEITEENIPTRDAVQEKLNTLYAIQERLSNRTSTFFRSAKEHAIEARLQVIEIGLRHLAAFMDEHPLYYDASFSPEERAEFRRLGLKEIIGVGEYDFRNNASYRKHNVRVTLQHIHKVMLQPEEEFSYWKLMYEKGLQEVVNGWLIVEGKEVWGWGGGLCGTSSTIFRAAWFSGLQITERRPHSIYYQSLYGRDPGLDAAVYQDSPNLRFVNNTGNPLMFYLRYNDTKDYAYLLVLGTKHFKDFTYEKGVRRGRAIQHTRIMTMKDGSTWEDPLYSAYNKME